MDNISQPTQDGLPFKYFPLNLISPSFDSSLTGLIIELEKLRDRIPRGTTPKTTFFQIKHIFHMLESIGSARIEGNRTTVLEYIETKIGETTPVRSESIEEINNMEEALTFIDNNFQPGQIISRSLISELHKTIVKGLVGEGSKMPGEYRRSEVKIKGSKHIPPKCGLVPSYMDEMFQFINNPDEGRFDLIKTALAHHRFVWIHPFDNGNGRTVRLLTYLMLVKFGFNVHIARILNPTAVFCHDRSEYYRYLGGADSGEEKELLMWCEYMLSGLKREIQSVDRLSDYSFLKSNILLPAISYSLERKLLTDIESKILNLAITKKEIKNEDIRGLFPSRGQTDISRLIRKLKDKKMLMTVSEKKRRYVLCFRNNYLLRGVIMALDKNGFLPIN